MFQEWLAEMLRHSAFLGWSAEHFEGDSQNLGGMSLHNSVHTSETATVIGQIDIVASGDISTINPLSLVQCGQPAL